MEQLAVTDGGESGRESEPEQHQLQSLSLPIPNIVTGIYFNSYFDIHC